MSFEPKQRFQSTFCLRERSACAIEVGPRARHGERRDRLLQPTDLAHLMAPRSNASDGLRDAKVLFGERNSPLPVQRRNEGEADISKQQALSVLAPRDAGVRASACSRESLAALASDFEPLLR